MTIKNRIQKLEQKNPPGGKTIIVIDWGGPTLTVEGIELTRAEVDKLYPPDQWTNIDWWDKPGDQDEGK